MQEFGSDADREMMRAYIRRLNVFRNSTTIIEYINANHVEESLNHSFYIEIVTKFGKEWENKTLQDAENYKIELCRECHFLSSCFARMSIRRSSIAIVFCFPFSIEAEVNCLEALFIKTKADQVFLHGTCVFDVTGQVRKYGTFKGTERRGEGMEEAQGWWREGWSGVEGGVEWCGGRGGVVWREGWSGVEGGVEWCGGRGGVVWREGWSGVGWRVEWCGGRGGVVWREGWRVEWCGGRGGVVWREGWRVEWCGGRCGGRGGVVWREVWREGWSGVEGGVEWCGGVIWREGWRKVEVEGS